MIAVADASEYILTVGKIGGALAGTMVALGLLAKSPVGRAVKWLYVRVAGEPVGEWFRHQVRTAAEVAIDEKLLKRNGGTTIPDVVHRIEVLSGQVEANHQESAAMHRENRARLDLIEAHGRT